MVCVTNACVVFAKVTSIAQSVDNSINIMADE